MNIVLHEIEANCDRDSEFDGAKSQLKIINFIPRNDLKFKSLMAAQRLKGLQIENLVVNSDDFKQLDEAKENLFKIIHRPTKIETQWHRDRRWDSASHYTKRAGKSRGSSPVGSSSSAYVWWLQVATFGG